MKNKIRIALSSLDPQYSVLPCLLLIATALYYQALQSRFLLDDFYNLLDLSQIDANGIAYFIFGGFSGPSGRPLSLLSFALQYQDWPGNPFAFKLVNLIIHLLNGVLIWFICKRLVVYIFRDKQYQTLLVILTTGLWLLHPIQFSTVLYVTQRMTQFSTFFILSGILGYLWTREQYANSGSQRALVLMSIFVTCCTVLAILGKENGILLPLFIIVIEATLLYDTARPTVWKWWAAVFLVLPMIVLVGYLMFNMEQTLQTYHARPYTLTQRLMTETTILLSYLKDLIIPSYGAFTLYHDDFPISKSLFEPIYTFFSVISILLLLFFSIILHSRIPVLSFALLWFFSGHLLESTYLNLELYFEHRNYLPSLGIFFGMSWLIVKFLKNAKSLLLSSSPIILYIIFVLIISVMEARLWAKPVTQITEWARLHPTSVRALKELATLHIKNNEYERAVEVYGQVYLLQPSDIYPAIQKINIENCKQKKHYGEEAWQAILADARISKRYGLTLVAALDVLTVSVVKGECEGINTEYLNQLLMILINNKDFSLIRGYLYEFAAILKLRNADYADALNYIRLSIKKQPRLSTYIYEIRVLKLMGRHDEADNLIETFKEKVYKDPRKYLAYRNIIKSLQ